MIPIGTLCLVVRPKFCSDMLRLAGRSCTVRGPTVWFEEPWPYQLTDLMNLYIAQHALVPIAPPGDPDVLDTYAPKKEPTHEPA